MKSSSATTFGSILALACLLGCTTIQPPTQTVLGSTKVIDKNYRIGIPEEAVVGSDVIRVKDYSMTRIATDKVRVLSDFTIDDIHYTQGQVYPYAGSTTLNKQQYDLMLTADQHALAFDSSGNVLDKIVNGIGAQPEVMIYTFAVSPPGKHLERVVEEKGIASPGSQNYQIIFTGITGDSIRLSYREYSPEDLARPAYQQDLTYPLTSKQIRFRSLAIGVNAVDAEKINFTVLKD